jgi:ABC-type multidrug transport system fused ATPase/permease subunit
MKTLVRLLSFLRPYRAQVIVTALSAAGLMACTAAIPWLTRVIIDDALRANRRDLLVPLIVAVLAVGLVRMLFAGLRRWVSGHVSLGVEYDLRGQMFRHIQRLSFRYFDHMPVGQLMSRVTNDLQTVRFFLGYGLIFLFMNAFGLVLYTVLLLLIDPALTGLALLMAPALIAVAWRSSKRTQPVLIDVQQKVADVTQSAEESIVGIRVIKAFGQEDAQNARFSAISQRAFDRSMDANRLQAFYMSLMGFLPTIGLSVVVIFGGIRAIDGQLSVGEFVQFYSYLLALVFPLRMIGSLVGNAQRAAASGQRIFEVLDTEPDLTERTDPLLLPDGGGHVEFVGVSFTHLDDGPEVLTGIDLDIPAGRVVALIGPTGSGKTTLTHLIPRYYDPSEGVVRLDGLDVRDVGLDPLRRAVGVVAQEPFLFSTTVRENIAYGVLDATDEAVHAAARLAQAEDFINELPSGFDTVIGERGYTLSGGQRQRIAIARAVLTDPRVLILDEATASVDASTEREIQEALRAVMAGRTTLIIAHRLSTISLADEVIVLDGGRVVARGTSHELYASNPIYREIHDRGLARPELVVGP